jgi:hypothetical protein
LALYFIQIKGLLYLTKQMEILSWTIPRSSFLDLFKVILDHQN